MATAVYGNSMTPLPTTNQPNRPVLRRATYVHVSDLTSAYNIDHGMLEQELSRVKAEQEAGTETGTETQLPTVPPDVGDTDVDTGADSEIGAALGATPQKRLQPPRGGYNLCVLVGKVNVVVDKRRVDRSRVRLAEVETGDETGTVSLRARDEQIDILEEVSKRSGAVVLRNCTLELYQGKHIRLAVTKWGKLCVYPDNVASTPPPPSKMNLDRNFSLIDLSVVASDLVDPHPETSYPNRFAGIGKPTKQPAEQSEHTSRPSSGRNQGGQSHSKHQQPQTSSRRNSRDRRHSRGGGGGGGGGGAGGITSSGGGGNNAAGKPSTTSNPSGRGHYGTSQSEIGQMQPPPQQPPTGQMRYHAMPAFPTYEQPMDLRQYAYAHGRQQEVIAPGSAQHLMLQQYELQQRQLQQMYHGQPDRHRSAMGQGHQVQTPGMLLQPVVPGAFDADYQVSSYAPAGSDQHPQVMSVVGSNPILIPMTMAGARAPSGVGAVNPEQYGAQAAVAARSRVHAPRGVMGGTDADQHMSAFAESNKPDSDSQFMSLSPDDSHFAVGKMNPEATAFAPSYIASPGGSHIYPQPNIMYENATYRQHPGIYTQPGIMYAPVGGIASNKKKSPPLGTGSQLAPSAPTPSSSAPQASSKPHHKQPGNLKQHSGKDNLKSPP